MKYKEICSELPNVYLLDNSFQEIEPGLNVYGSTLWTYYEIYKKKLQTIIILMIIVIQVMKLVN